MPHLTSSADGSEIRPYLAKATASIHAIFPAAKALGVRLHCSMPLPERRWLHHTPPNWVSDSIYFITICCAVRGKNQLCTPVASQKLFAAVRHNQEQLRWHVSLWLLMPDHLHALIFLPHDEDLSKVIPAGKRFTARDSNVVWQGGFFDHRVRSDESLEEKAHYIRMNPVRKGLVEKAEDWPHLISR